MGYSPTVRPQGPLAAAFTEDEREILAELSAERLIPLIGERAARVLAADCTIYSIERQGRWLRRIWSNWEHPLDGMPIGVGGAGVCATTGRGILVPDYSAWPQALPAFLELGVKAIIAEPLLGGSELLGVIVMSRRGVAARAFDTADASLLERLAAQGAVALRNARLYGEAEQRRRAAEELARTARTLSDRQDPTAVAQEIQRSVLAVFDVYSCNIRLLRPDGGLEALAANMYEVGHVQPPGIGLSARALAQGRAVWTSDLLHESDVSWDEDFRQRNLAAGRRATLVVPLRTERGIIGVFQMSSPVVRDFSPHEVELAQAFADQAGARERAPPRQPARQRGAHAAHRRHGARRRGHDRCRRAHHGLERAGRAQLRLAARGGPRVGARRDHHPAALSRAP
jgi:GAF domain-containing protein